MTDGIGTVFAPAHAGAFEALSHDRLARRLDRPGADLPALRLVVRIVHAMHVVADILHQFTVRLAGRRATPTQVELLQRIEHGLAAFVFHGVTPLLGQSFGRGGVARLPELGQVVQLFGRMVEIQNQLGKREVRAQEILQSAAAVRQRDLSLGSVPAHLRRLASQRPPQFVETVQAAK